MLISRRYHFGQYQKLMFRKIALIGFFSSLCPEPEIYISIPGPPIRGFCLPFVAPATSKAREIALEAAII